MVRSYLLETDALCLDAEINALQPIAIVFAMDVFVFVLSSLSFSWSGDVFLKLMPGCPDAEINAHSVAADCDGGGAVMKLED